MKRMNKSKALALTGKLSFGFFAPSASTPLITAGRLLQARRGLWQLLIFLLLSMLAWITGEKELFNTLPEAFVAWLGAPPPLFLIDLALVIYLLSALILLPGRLSTHRGSSQDWTQLFYRTIFYLIYLASSALAERFVVILAIGLALYGLEQLYLWGMTLWDRNGTGQGATKE